ncbi:MAG: hypothetical protein EB023_14825 [Flavobacteriia bacterium]|nr:hypothetical protein [Flavobacteriia bacterium]
MVGSNTYYFKFWVMFLTMLFIGFSIKISAQKTIHTTFIAYSFGLQKMDFIHQLSAGFQGKHMRLEVQQGVGQRNLASGVLFSQTGLQSAYTFQLSKASLHPFLRYSYGLLAKPFGFHYHRAELGMLCVYQWSRCTKIPFDLTFSGGVGKGLEVQAVHSRHGYIDYSINLGLQYAFR